MTIAERLEQMWFGGISDDEPLYVYSNRQVVNVWMVCETQVPMPTLITLQLKREGYQPMYIQEVDMERDQAIISYVMEV